MATLTSQRVTAGGRNNDVLFHRRLDRTPESVDKFRRLSPENKEKIHDLRAAVAGACLKMSLLEDDVEEKQAAIEHEHALRLAAEARLEEGLVDMYGDPAVTQELCQRLPRAVSDGRRRTQSLSPRFRGHRVPASQMTVGDNLQRNKEDVSAHHQGDVRRSLDFSEGSRRRTRKDRRRHRKSGSSSGEDDVSDGVSDPSEHVSRVRGKQDPSLPGRPPEAPVNTAPQILHPPTNVSPAAFVSPYLTMVVAQPVTCIPQTIPQAPPIVHRVSAPTLPHASQSPPLGGRLSAPIPSTDPLTLGSASAKQVSYLLEELRLARESNKQLTEKLTSCEQELVSTKHALHTKEVENDLSITGQVAAVIEEIEQQHQEREASVLGRLRLANQERDSMYSRLKHYGAIPDDEEETREDLEEEDISSDEFLELDVQQLLSQVNTQSSLGRISRTADHVTALIQATQRRREEVIAEEMGVVLEERDVALAKCQRLEKQLIQCERKANPYNLHPSPDRALQTQLAKAHQALNESQCKVQDLEEELQTLRIYHSVRKDVLTETELNNTVDLYEVQLHEKDSRVSSVQKENNILLAQLRGTAEELEKTRASLRETTKHNQQLERLVKVLKRKINTPDGQHGLGL